MRAADTDVLIAGAGPTGLVLAASLAAHGVPFRLIDAAERRSDRSRALVVHARSLEILDRFGLAGRLVDRGRTGLGVALFVEREPAARLELTDIGVEDTAFPFLLFISQVETERVLDEHLDERGARIAWSTRLVDFEQDAEGVSVRLAGPAGEEVVRCRYLVGCDGAHSAVRKGAGLRFEGAPYEQDFVLADVRMDWAPAIEGLHMFMERRQFAAVFPLAAPDVWRVMASRIDVSADAPDPTLAEIQAILDQVSPIPARLHEPTWLARFRLHHRGVDRYRAGRVFVAGDAAHIHSPAGGQGMNTGMQDAYNLGWKLALALQGSGDGALLDSYHVERHPVGQKLLEFTDRAFSLASSQNTLITGLRNFLLPLIAPRVLESRERRARAFRFASQLAIRYSRSPIVEEVSAGADASFRAGPHAGARAPDGWLKDPRDGEPTRLHTRLDPTCHHLIVFTGRDPSIGHGDIEVALERIFERFPRRLRTHIIAGRQLTVQDHRALLDEDGALHARYGVENSGVVVVRPDGYIGFRSPGTQLDAAASFLIRRLG